MNILFYIFCVASALLPNIIWLFFYLKKDRHPEPKSKILEVFFLGVIMGIVVLVIEAGILKIVGASLYQQEGFWFMVFKYFIFVGLIEEFAKYIVVKKFVIHDCVIDEPLDVMLYLIISALGFSALENFLLVFNITDLSGTTEILRFSAERLIGATFLHTLSSGVLGFFWALSLYSAKYKKTIFSLGMVLAVFAHGLYNFCMVNFSGILEYVIFAVIIASLATFTTFGFLKLKKLKSICKITTQ